MAVIVVVPNPDTETGLPRIAASLVSSLRAVRGQVPAADRIKVVEFADPQGGSEAATAAVESQVAESRVAESRAVDLPPVPVPPAAPEGEATAIERQVLEGWWSAAVRTGQGRGTPEDLAAALAGTAHFARQQRPPVHTARELRRYLTDHKFRHELRERTQACIGPETKVVVGHALGALIAYEALCAINDAIAVSLVTLGPALCGPRVVFDLLDPAPRSNQGEWPASVRHWSNIVAHTDLTAQCEATADRALRPRDRRPGDRAAHGDREPVRLPARPLHRPGRGHRPGRRVPLSPRLARSRGLRRARRRPPRGSGGARLEQLLAQLVEGELLGVDLLPEPGGELVEHLRGADLDQHLSDRARQAASRAPPAPPRCAP